MKKLFLFLFLFGITTSSSANISLFNSNILLTSSFLKLEAIPIPLDYNLQTEFDGIWFLKTNKDIIFAIYTFNGDVTLLVMNRKTDNFRFSIGENHDTTIFFSGVNNFDSFSASFFKNTKELIIDSCIIDGEICSSKTVMFK